MHFSQSAERSCIPFLSLYVIGKLLSLSLRFFPALLLHLYFKVLNKPNIQPQLNIYDRELNTKITLGLGSPSERKSSILRQLAKFQGINLHDVLHDFIIIVTRKDYRLWFNIPDGTVEPEVNCFFSGFVFEFCFIHTYVLPKMNAVVKCCRTSATVGKIIYKWQSCTNPRYYSTLFHQTFI